jgi:hypothetical protein
VILFFNVGVGVYQYLLIDIFDSSQVDSLYNSFWHYDVRVKSTRKRLRYHGNTSVIVGCFYSYHVVSNGDVSFVMHECRTWDGTEGEGRIEKGS